MPDFDLTDEQRAVRELAHDFAAREIRPVAAELDDTAEFPHGLVRKAWEVGLMNVHVERAYGGPELDDLSSVLIAEEVAWGCAGVSTTLGNNELAAGPLTLAAEEHIKRRYLGQLTSEPALAAFCLTEPDAGSDVSGLRSRAVRMGDRWILNGSKCFITNGAHADWFVVFAKTDPAAGQRGISAFVVPRDAPGEVVVDKKERKMGQRCSNTAGLTFNDVEVPLDHLLGTENKGFKLAMMTLDRTRAGVAAQAVGIARAALEASMEYARGRQQFGVPIAMHQAVAFLIADMATDIEAARLMTWQAAWMTSHGRYAGLQSSHAKRFAADMAMRVTTDAVQVHGGYGYMADYGVEKWMRDAKLLQLFEGTSQVQRLVIARELFMPRNATAEVAA